MPAHHFAPAPSQRQFAAAAVRLTVSVLFSLTLPAYAETPLQCRGMSTTLKTLTDKDPAALKASSKKLDIYADRANVNPEGVSVVEGDVTIAYKNRKVRADAANYDATTGELRVDGDVRLESENLLVNAKSARFESQEDSGSFTQADFTMLDREGHGEAGQIVRPDDNTLILKNVRYTACPAGQSDWLFISPEITIDREEQIGKGKNVRVEFKGVPILYTPYISFPVGENRKSGILLPSWSSNDRSGAELAIPFYWNMAPNYDALFTVRHLTQRGTEAGMLARYLFTDSEGKLEAEYLPSDSVTDSDRIHGIFKHSTRLQNGLRFEVDAEDVSDGRYFEDLTSSLAGASTTHLERRIDLYHESEHWLVGLRGQAFSTLDRTILDANKPYRRMPQMLVQGQYGQPNRLNFSFDSDLTNFERDDGARGLRADLQPAVSLPISRGGFLIEPSVKVAYTHYDLKELDNAGQDDTGERTVPIYSLDGRLFFERETGKAGVLQTLEPRIRYTHIPFVAQSGLPVFDTGTPDINLIQLFRDNRYSGIDRIGDTDQLSLGLTTRLINTNDGRSLLTATLGQALYLSQRNVSLNQESLSGDSSSIIAEIGLGFSRIWNADLEYQWSPDTRATSKAVVRLQYQPAANKVINLAYRFQRNDLEQSDLSFAWPIGDNWNVVGRWNYSIDEAKTLERFAGVEYNRCCWSVRLVSRRFLNNRDGGQDTALFAQFELKGLTSIGARVDAFLEEGILGYGQFSK